MSNGSLLLVMRVTTRLATSEEFRASNAWTTLAILANREFLSRRKRKI